MRQKRVFQMIKQACLACGLDVQHAANTMDRARMREFRRLGISLVLDVGANHGQYTRLLRQSGYGGRIISYEPIPEVFDELVHTFRDDKQWQGENCALSRVAGRSAFHVSKNTVSSSLLNVTGLTTEVEPGTTLERNINVEIRTLDDELAKNPSEERIHLKLDVQGGELDALVGGKNALSRINSVECELSFASLYSGQPLYFEVGEFLHRMNFRAVWFDRGFQSRDGQLLQIDAFFVRDADCLGVG